MARHECVGDHPHALRLHPPQHLHPARMQRRSVDQDGRALRLGDGAARFLDQRFVCDPEARAQPRAAREAPFVHAISAGMISDTGPGGGP